MNNQPNTDPVASVTPSFGKLHCPNCKSRNISVTTESSINGALHTGNRRVSSTVVSNSHRQYWICSDCGSKFRNIQSLEEEISSSKGGPLLALIIGIVCLAVAIFFTYQSSSNLIGGILFFPVTAGAYIGFLVSFILHFVYRSRLKKMKTELAWLKENCFN